MGKKIGDFLKKNPSSAKANSAEDANPYAAYMRKLAATPPEEYAKMGHKKKAAVAGAKSWVKQQDDVKLAAARMEAQQRAEFMKAQEENRQAKIAAIRSQRSVIPEITVGKVAQYTLNPLDLQPTFRGFKYAAAILVQIFARILITVGLIAPDHPARTPSGALGYGLFRLLEEARVNLLPLSVFREKQTAAQFATIRMLAARQYIVFSATVGMFVTGFLAILMEIAHTIFGSAYAFAASTPSVPTSGITMGGCPAIASYTGNDYASACLDGIFGTAAGSTASVVQSGLGTMLALYSNMVLVFAGIIVLWIIVSAVAETARTGVPFGKNFNSVWAPIRLVAALGMLVPLGSNSLNSGQYIVISLAKWGSLQATNMWNSYAQKMTAGTGSNSNSDSSNASNSTLPSVVLNTEAATNFAKNMFKIALCEEVSNQTCALGQTGNICPGEVTRTAPIPVAQSSPAASISSTAATSTPAITTINQVRWYSAVEPNGLPVDGTAYCGSVNLVTPSGTSANNNQTSVPQTAAQTAINSLINSQTALVTQTMENTMQSAAQKVAQDAVTIIKNKGAPLDTSSDYSGYQTALSNYVGNNASSSNNSSGTGIQQVVENTVKQYNSAVNSAAASPQQVGWIYAPVWLVNIISANAMVADAANALPTIVPPTAEPFDANTMPEAQQAWDQAMKIIQNGDMKNPTTSDSYQKMSSIYLQLQDLTSKSATNPLVVAGTVGHSLLMSGFRAITPQDVASCLDGTGTYTVNGQKQTADCSAFKGSSSITGGQNVLTGTDAFANVDKSVRPLLNGVGIIMISMGFTLIMLTFIPLLRFILGILNWIIQVFEAVLAVPMISLSLLATGGDGFATQQFTTDLWMLVGVVLRPMLMAIGMVLSLSAFNNIMQIVNAIFAPAVAGMTDPSDNSLLTLGVYITIYSSLAYTLANSAFKLIDMLPNWVMTWIGARLESRADDASAIQQMSQGYVQNLAFSNRADQVDLGGKRQRTADTNSRAELARNIRENPNFQKTEGKATEAQQKQDAWELAGKKMGIQDNPK